MYIGLTSAKTIANKGLVVATGSGASNYTGIETSALGGTFNSIGLLASGNGFGGGTNAIGGQFSATNATNNYAIEISSGTATDSLSYAIYSSSVAKTYLNGKLGLGTTTPDSALTVNGGGRFTGGLKVDRGLNLAGGTTISGTTSITGATTVTGNTTINGNLMAVPGLFSLRKILHHITQLFREDFGQQIHFGEDFTIQLRT
jgi:hypothetical protein